MDFATPRDGDDGEENAPEDESPALASRRYGHFEILADAAGAPVELGHGAMGTTYRARDTVLQRDVALKIINRNVADDPAARARFLREARAAAQFQHPNVAAVSHHGEQAGECYYVMELVEGETLEQRVRRDGPLATGPALEIVVQTARALRAAEERGIIHRDLKPSNLMLAAARDSEPGAGETFQVKVIDFGLARVVSALSAAGAGPFDTREGFVGTPSFASPEQFARDAKVPVDIRSDIYSLGVTLWYLLAGRAPFVGSTLSQIGELQRAPLPWEQLKDAHVPRPVLDLLASMLAVDPGARPQSARELYLAAVDCRERLPGIPVPYGRARVAVLAVGLVFAVAVAVVLAWPRQPAKPALPPPGPPPDRSIAVLPFENLSPDKADAFYTTAVQDEITADLARLPALTVTSPSSTKEYQPDGKRDLPAIGRELGVTHLLEASCRRDGPRMHIALRLADLQDPARSWTQQYDRQLADIFAVQGEIARAITERLQLSLSPAERATLNRPPTRDLVAYQLYQESKQNPSFFPSPAAIHEFATRRIALVNQAVARDPDFALAWCWLADLHYYAAGNSDSATPAENVVDDRALGEVALQKARTLQPDSGEVHLVTARHLIAIHDNTGQALTEAELACRALPNNATAASIRADIDCQYGRWDEAIRWYERASALDPRHGISRWRLARAYAALRQYDNYERAMAATLAVVSGNTKADFLLQRAARRVEAGADLAPLRAGLAETAAADDEDGLLRTAFGLTLKMCERDPAGMERLLAGGSNGGGNGGLVDEGDNLAYPKPWFAAMAVKLRGDAAATRAAFAAARPEIEKAAAAASSPDGQLLGLLALADAALGRNEDAVREAKHACELAPYETSAEVAPVVRCELAAVYAWTGQTDLALGTLDEAAGRAAGEGLMYQPTYGDLRLNPMWDELRKDARFEAIVQRLAPGRK